VTSLLTFLSLAFLMPLFHDLPEAVLAAIVIHAVAHLADVKELRRFASLRTGSIWAALTALVGVLAFGILKGLVLAVCLTLAALMKKLSTPHESVLGRLPGTQTFVDVARYPEAELIPGLLIFRPNGMLFFANANRVVNHLKDLVRSSKEPLKAVLLNFEAVAETDITSLDLLEQLRADFAAAGVRLCLARVSDPVLDLFRRSGFSDRLGTGSLFRGVDAAVEDYRKAAAG
jgi:MFS superfamily sulfate permease-like transporter